MCDDHADDEDHLTAPDVMYAKAKINSTCMECHSKKKLAADNAHTPLLAGTPTKGQVCTDCHGKHRLARRIRRWDKRTGKLLDI